MNRLVKVSIEGYKSIKNTKLEFGDITVLIGGNGAGKSNLISFFELIDQIQKYNLQNYVMKQGGANVLLYNGKKITNECYFQVYRDQYMFYGRLTPNNADALFFAQQGLYDYKNQHNIYAADGFMELKDQREVSNMRVLSDIGRYHFHDTSTTSLMKSYCNINNNEFLSEDGGNIAAFLYRIQKTDDAAFQQIENVIQMVAPYFMEFHLRPNPFNTNQIRLEWKKKGCDIPFGAEQLSDGTLRFICLTALLCAPDNVSRDVIIIDEPELGLHPFAITLVAELMKRSALERQLIIATQSVELLNEFEPENVIVVDNEKGESKFQKVDKAMLEEWMDEYTLGELWQKNLLGGRP